MRRRIESCRLHGKLEATENEKHERKFVQDIRHRAHNILPSPSTPCKSQSLYGMSGSPKSSLPSSCEIIIELDLGRVSVVVRLRRVSEEDLRLLDRLGSLGLVQVDYFVGIGFELQMGCEGVGRWRCSGGQLVDHLVSLVCRLESLGVLVAKLVTLGGLVGLLGVHFVVDEA